MVYCMEEIHLFLHASSTAETKKLVALPCNPSISARTESGEPAIAFATVWNDAQREREVCSVSESNEFIVLTIKSNVEKLF